MSHKSTTMKKAVFLDRDGTIINDVGYINKITDVEFYPFTYTALQQLSEYFLLFIITNQSGVAKGFITKSQVKAVNKHIELMLNKNSIKINKTYCCTHKPGDNCKCMKPSGYFINQAARYYDIDLSKSFIIGDHPTDIICGINSGVTPLYLLSGHGLKHLNELKYDVKICNNILSASKYILSTIKN